VCEMHDKLKTEWFALFERVYAETRAETSSLPCSECCGDYLCETNERVYFLPFEAEFIEMRTGRDIIGNADIWKIEMPFSKHLAHSVGLKDEFRLCPFFNAEKRCDIYENRPLDCRSFPAMPVFPENGIDFEFESYCPALEYASSSQLKDHTLLHKAIWGRVAEILPKSWKIFYWNTERLLPEITEPKPHPRHVDICGRLATVFGNEWLAG